RVSLARTSFQSVQSIVLEVRPPSFGYEMFEPNVGRQRPEGRQRGVAEVDARGFPYPQPVRRVTERLSELRMKQMAAGQPASFDAVEPAGHADRVRDHELVCRQESIRHLFQFRKTSLQSLDRPAL